MQKPKVIVHAFHGCGQNKETFNNLLKPMKAHKMGWTTVCRDGFYSLSKGRSWYNLADSAPNPYRKPLPQNPKLNQCYRNIVAEAKKYNQKVVLLGFSQGAMFVCELAYRFRNDPENPIAAVVAIAPPYFDRWKWNAREGVCHIPLVLVTSPGDTCVRPADSAQWCRHFSTSHIYESNQGHKTHFSGDLRALIRSVVERSPSLSLEKTIMNPNPTETKEATETKHV